MRLSRPAPPYGQRRGAREEITSEATDNPTAHGTPVPDPIAGAVTAAGTASALVDGELIDPSGNSIIFIQRDEPAELEYGGSKKLTGLAKALDNARILREFKNDDLQAFRALKSAVHRHGADASVVERAIALCHLIDLAMVLGEPTDPWLADLHGLELTLDDRQRIESELGHLAGLQERLP